MEKVELMTRFQIPGKIESIEPYGNGHINDTFLASAREGDVRKRYILQKINTEVFQKPDELMENLVNVTSYLRNKIIRAGGDPQRETLNIVFTKDGKSYFRDENGKCYRVYLFIEDATSLEQVRNETDFYESAVSFGRFQYLLSEYPAKTLHETIPDFHNTKKRFQDFLKAVKADKCGRLREVGEEVQFVIEHEADISILGELLEKKELPLRVTHNDTKLNNIMMDNQTGKGICVIDLDTVMPGLSLYDFGDSIRFGANTAAEDEQELCRVGLDINLFQVYTKGYIKGCQGALTPKEIRLLPMGAKVMTLECGIRFLTDYLQGDIYFRIHKKGHNLDRARTQFALARDMEAKWKEMCKIVEM